MDFFSELTTKFEADTKITMVIMKNKIGEMTVSVLPHSEKKEAGQLDVVPVFVKGRPPEIDEKFMDIIGNAIETQDGVITTIEQYKADLKAQGNKATGVKEKRVKRKMLSRKHLMGCLGTARRRDPGGRCGNR